MIVLVTGATGFVGLHVVRRLVGHGARVIGFSANEPDAETARFLGEASSGVTFIRGDVRDREFLTAVCGREGADRIVHAAALTPSPDLERAAPATVVDTNLGGTVNALEAARACAAQRVVLVSSSGLYGSPEDPDRLITETTPPRASGLYALCKVAGEGIGRRYAALGGPPVVAARVGTVYGPMERPTPTRQGMSEVYTLAHAALRGTAVAIHGADVRRDYCYADDVAEALAGLTLADTLTWDLYNVGSGAAPSVGAVATSLANLVPGFVWEAVDTPAAADLVVLSAKARGPMDLTRLTRDLNFRPEYSLTSGLASYVSWLRTVNDA
ncbi:MAG TPA: NAD(P)-dependent oxidoreductase [bacterium]|nr:NAD(P)-dependent oxidoreductase [bacterium]